MTSYQDAYLQAALNRLDGPERAVLLAKAEALTHKWDLVPGTDPYFGRRWRELLRMPVSEIREIVLANTEEGRRLRHTMPLAGFLSSAERADLRRRVGMTLSHP